MAWEEEFQYKPPTDEESKQFNWLCVYVLALCGFLYGLVNFIDWVFP